MAAVAALVVACSGDDAAPASTDGDAGNATPTPPPDTTAPPPGTDPDAGVDITDGGENLDPDAAAGDIDASIPPDAGVLLDGGVLACNATALGTAIDTTCSSKQPLYAGGALVAGTYDLVGVTVLGSSLFCTSTFKSTSLSGGLVLTVDAQGVGTVQRATNDAAPDREPSLGSGRPGALSLHEVDQFVTVTRTVSVAIFVAPS